MDKILINKKAFSIAQNGMQMMGNEKLFLRIATGDFDAVQDALAESNSITQTLEDGTKVAVYNGMTKILSIKKVFNQKVGYNQIAHDVEHTITDEETGIEQTVTETEWEFEPIISDVIEVELARPTLEEAVAENAAQVSELQMMVKDILVNKE